MLSVVQLFGMACEFKWYQYVHTTLERQLITYLLFFIIGWWWKKHTKRCLHKCLLILPEQERKMHPHKLRRNLHRKLEARRGGVREIDFIDGD